MKKPATRLAILLTFWATFAAAQKPYDFAASGQENETLSLLINARENPEMAKPDYYGLPNYYSIVRKDGKFGIWDEMKKQFYRQPIYDSITLTGNCFIGKKWTNFLYGDPVVNYNPTHPDGIIFKKGKKYGLKRLDGAPLLNGYDDIHSIGSKTFVLKKKNQYGFAVVADTLKIVDGKFDYVILKPAGNEPAIAAYKNLKEVLYGFDGRLFTPKPERPFVYEPQPFRDNYAYTHGFFENGKVGIKDSDERTLVPAIYDAIKPSGANNHVYVVSHFTANDTLHGLIDKYGKVIFPIKFAQLDLLESDIYKAGSKQNFGLYDKEGKQIYSEEIDSLYQLNPMYVKGHRMSYYLMNPKAGAPCDLLKIENGTPIKVLENCTDIRFVASNREYLRSNILKFRKPGDPRYGALEAVSRKIISPRFKDVFFDYGQQLVLAKTANVPDVIITPELNVLTSPKKVIGYANGYFIYSEKRKMGVMDRNFKPAGFTYEKLETFFVETNEELLGLPAPKKKMLESWFSYRTGKKVKSGIVDYNGKIIVPAGEFDRISLLHYSTRDHKVNDMSQNPKMQGFARGIKLLCEKDNPVNGTTELTLRDESATIVSFEIAKDETWNFARYNNAILISSGDRLRVFNIDNKKTVLELKNGVFNEEYNGGYSYRTSGDSQYHYSRYSAAGKLIVEKYGLQLDAFKNKNAYIVKRNGKYGLVRVNDQIAIPFENDSLYTRNDEHYAVKKDNVWSIRNANNDILLDGADDLEMVLLGMGYDNYRYYCIARKGNKKRLYDYNLKLIPIDPADEIAVTPRHIFAKTRQTCTAYALTGERLFSLDCDKIDENSSDYFSFYRDNKIGLIDGRGKIVLGPNYSYVYPLAKNAFLAEYDSRKWLTDTTEKIRVDNIDQISMLDSHRQPHIYSNPVKFFVVMDKSGQTALYNPDKEKVIDYQNQQIHDVWQLRYVTVSRNGQVGVVDLQGKYDIPFVYDEIYFDAEGLYYQLHKAEKQFFMTPDGKIFFEQPR